MQSLTPFLYIVVLYGAFIAGSLHLRALLQLSRGTLPTRADLQVDDLTLDLATRMARRGKHVLPRLTALEGRLLHMLMIHRGPTLPTETLIERV
jgi:DNA-binding response OmpR family regulator